MNILAIPLMGVLCCTTVMSRACSSSRIGDPKQEKTWRPATYNHITVGSSNSTDVLRVFGKPVREDFAGDGPEAGDEVWYIYEKGGEFAGQFTIIIEKGSGIVSAMVLTPLGVTRKDLIEKLGDDYVVTRYDFCPGFDEAEAAPVFQSPTGNAIYFEYPSRGIAVLVDERGEVYDIRYLKTTVGFKSRSDCEQALAARKAGRRNVKRP